MLVVCWNEKKALTATSELDRSVMTICIRAEYERPWSKRWPAQNVLSAYGEVQLLAKHVLEHEPPPGNCLVPEEGFTALPMTMLLPKLSLAPICNAAPIKPCHVVSTRLGPEASMYWKP